MAHFGKKPGAAAPVAAPPTSAAPEAELKQEKAPEQEAPKPQKIMIRAVYGLMIHPYKPIDVRMDSITQVDEIDDWLKCQIEAGKIKVV